MKKAALIILLSGFTLTSATVALAKTHDSAHYDGEKLAKSAKVRIDEAQTIALKARSGEITGCELEKEKGGSGLRYSFDIKADGVTYEVGIDARTGAVLENAPEGKPPD